MLLETLENYSGKIAIDTETNGQELRDGSGYCVGVSLAWKGENALYLPFRHIDTEGNYDIAEFREILQFILDTFPIIFHNFTFDLMSLETLGLDTSKAVVFDTMLLTHLLDENVATGYKLDSLCQMYLGMGKKRSDEFIAWMRGFGWGSIPSELMCEYAVWDAYITYKLYEFLAPKLRQEKLGPVWYQKVKFAKLISKMERRGIRIDTELCRRKIAEGEAIMNEIIEKLGGLNPASPKDQYALFVEKLDLPVVYKDRKNGTATVSFDKYTMQRYDEILELRDDWTAKLVLAYRGWQKSISSNYKAYLELLSHDGRLRPNYKLHGTKTRRMSCEHPNLQQIPRSGTKPWNGEMKQCFIPRDGYVLIEADYAQLEFRISATYADQRELLAIFADPTRDIFTEISKGLGIIRYDGKTLVYALSYGAGTPRISVALDKPLNEAQAIKDNYFKNYPELLAVSNYAKKKVEKEGKIRLWNGSYRHMNKSDAHKAYNSVIQGGAAAIVEDRMIALEEEVCKVDECDMLLQVHDSVVFEIREDLVEHYTPLIRKCMEAVPAPFDTTTFKVDIHRWAA